jgi:hypothetical protein
MHRVQNLSIDIELVRAFPKQIQPRHRRRTDIAKRTWGSSVGVKAPEIVLHFSGTSFAGHLVFEFQPNGRLLFLVALTFQQIHGLGQRRTISAKRDEATRLG